MTMNTNVGQSFWKGSFTVVTITNDRQSLKTRISINFFFYVILYNNFFWRIFNLVFSRKKCTDCLLSYSFCIIFISITLVLESSYLGTTLCYYLYYFYFYYFYYYYLYYLYYHSKLRCSANATTLSRSQSCCPKKEW